MQRLFREPVLPVLAASCGAAVVVLPAGSPARLIAGIALVLVLPGAALGRAALPRRELSPEPMLVALGASAIVVALGASFLDVVDVPLKPTVWAPVLAILTVVGSVVGSLRDLRPNRGGLRISPSTPTDALMIGASLALIAGAVTLGTKPLRAPAGTPGSSALWIEANGTGHAAAIARSGELRSGQYELSVTVNGRTVAASPPFRLTPGEQHRVPAPSPLPAEARVGALLYRLDHGAPRLSGRAELTLGGSVPFASAATGP
jgi:hypothetical protein